MGARPYEWSDLEIFLAAARRGTLASAAEALRVDPSTVHRRIAKLEATMRASLFVRSPRGYALTEAGQDLGDRGRRDRDRTPEGMSAHHQDGR